VLDLELEFEEVTKTPQKRLPRDMGTPSRVILELTSNDDMEDTHASLDFDCDSMADFIVPSTPDHIMESQCDAIHSAIACTVSISDAWEKSAEQMDTISWVIERIGIDNTMGIWDILVQVIGHDIILLEAPAAIVVYRECRSSEVLVKKIVHHSPPSQPWGISLAASCIPTTSPWKATTSTSA
jgi:hypothetical protein